MIHYHGGPITPTNAAREIWTARHAMVSFANPQQIALAAEVCQSFAIDNGAFTIWRAGNGEIDLDEYAAFVLEWCRHPGFDWYLMPDVIGGTERDNERMMNRWCAAAKRAGKIWGLGVPVWHLHESLDRLRYFVGAYRRVAIGSSGEYSDPGRSEWWDRISEAMAVACDDEGRPKCKLHGLRMLNPTVFSHIPLASADSCGIARNMGLDVKWRNGYLCGLSPWVRALVLADRYERHASAAEWAGRDQQLSFTLLG